MEQQEAVEPVEASQEQLRETLSALQGLRRSQGWALLCKVATAQLQTRRDKLELTPLSGMDAVLEQEFNKGEIAAIRLFMQLPQTVIDDLTDQLKELEEQGEDDANQAPVDDAG